MTAATLGGFVALAGITAAFASGYGQHNFDWASGTGVYRNQIDVLGNPSLGITGYVPAPLKTASTGTVVTHYDFTIQRYTGAGHVPYTQAISIPLTVRVRHIDSITGSSDSSSSLAAGDPTLGTAAGSGNSAPYSEAWLEANWRLLDESASNATIAPASTFTVKFGALPSGTSDANAAAQTQQVSLTITLKQCGYYEIDSGTPGVDNGGGFAVLTSGFVRATGCSTAGGNGGGVQGVSVSVPDTGAGAGMAAGAAVAGLGLVSLVAAGWRRRR